MTQPNLRKPPAAAVADLQAEVVPRLQKQPRPISAWLLMVIMTIIALIAVVSLNRLVWSLAPRWQHLVSLPLFVGAICLQVAKIVILVATTLGVYRGRRWARWLGLAVIVGFAIFAVVSEDHTVYPNDAQRAGAQLTQTVFPFLCIWWAWAFAFTAKAKRYFAGAPADAA